MGFNRFRWGIIARIIGLNISLAIAILLFLKTSYFFLLVFTALVFIFQVFNLIHYIEVINREISRFFRSIENDDFTQSFSFKNYGSSFRQLSESFSQVTERFLKLRSEKEENFQYLQTVIQHIKAGVITFRGSGEVELINNATKKLLGIAQLRHLKMLDNINPQLSQKMQNLQPGETVLIKFEKNGESIHLAVHATQFKLLSKSYTLLSLQDIKSEIERERMAKELEIARQIQQRLFPHENPSLPGFDIAGSCIPAQEVGGDYYDFIPDERGKLGIVIGDVSGKGLPASIYMTLTKGIFQSHSSERIHPKDLLSSINRFMYQSLEKNVFITLYFAVLDPKSKEFTVARAGHLPALHYQQAKNSLMLIEPKGIGVGLEKGEVFDKNIDSLKLVLQPGDWVIFYTDGFSEAMKNNGQEYGDKRLHAFIKDHLNLSASALIEALIANVNEFTAGAPMKDDMTIIAIKIE
jgi:serine phosphatase RsbU (regulator of sigma subunit)